MNDENMISMESPESGEKAAEGESLKKAKKSYSEVGLFFFVFTIIVNVVQIIYTGVVAIMHLEGSWVQFGTIFVSVDLVGFPIMLLMFLKRDKLKPEKNKVSFGVYLIYAAMCMTIIYAGSYIGNIVNLLITLPFSSNETQAMEATNVVGQLLDGAGIFGRVFVVGICAPVFEELLFRKLLIERVLKYGEMIAIIVSGVMFGLFHGNFSQFFYAVGLGMFFAYIYIRTGKIWYTIGLHMIVNLTSSVVSMYVLSIVDMNVYQEILTNPQILSNPPQYVVDALPGIGIYMAYSMLLMLIAFFGFIMWIYHFANAKKVVVVDGENTIVPITDINKKKFFIKKQAEDIPKGKRFKTAFINGGMLTYVIIWVLSFVMYYFVIIYNMLVAA